MQSASKTSKHRESRPALAANDTKTEPKNNKTIDETQDEEDGSKSYWLMKAEPESRMEKGVDVKFSIDDLREASEPEAWDGESSLLHQAPRHKSVYLRCIGDCWISC